MTARITYSLYADIPATYNVGWGAEINFVAVEGVNTLVFPNAKVSPPEPGVPTSETFSLISLNSQVSIVSGWGTTYTGNINVWGGGVAMIGQKWTATGPNYVGNGAKVMVSLGNGANQPSVDGDGTFLIYGNSTMEFQYSPASHIDVRDGTLQLDVNWDKQDITLQTAGRSEVDIGVGDWQLPLAGTTSYDIKGDLLIFHDATTAETGRIVVHNQTNQAIQVDRPSGNNYQLAIVADNTPRPGMIVGHPI